MCFTSSLSIVISKRIGMTFFDVDVGLMSISKIVEDKALPYSISCGLCL